MRREGECVCVFHARRGNGSPSFYLREVGKDGGFENAPAADAFPPL